MGLIINFPDVGNATRAPRAIVAGSRSATVVILPVIRIERYSDEPAGSFAPVEATGNQRRRRRRRSSRS
jgi:hypothetical protein